MRNIIFTIILSFSIFNNIFADQNLIISNLTYNSIGGLESILFPKIKPYNHNFLQEGLHKLYYAEFGNPVGIPVIVVHGGPGSGCSEDDPRWFDPKYYRIITLDQRGSGKSKPAGELKDNTTNHLIEDMEKLRLHLDIDKWILFGGSWGSALSIAYGETYPKNCLGFILRGIFLTTKSERNHIWNGGRDIVPEIWEELVNYLPQNERSDFITSYQQRISHINPKISYPASHAFMKYSTQTMYALKPPALESLKTFPHLVRNLARAYVHYDINNFYLKENQLMENLYKISHLPSIIIQGRFDIKCRPVIAYNLHKNWPKSRLIIVQDGGHSSSEETMAINIIKATEDMKRINYFH